MFPSNKSNDKLITLENYINNMKDNQDGIYYIIGNTIDNVKNSAFIEKLVKKDYEILFMCDPLDEYIMQQIHEYDNKKFINVIKDNLNITVYDASIGGCGNNSLYLRVKNIEKNFILILEKEDDMNLSVK